MSEETNDTIDLIRWTFTPDPAHRVELENHLLDAGLDVHVKADGQFIVLWDEPEGEVEGLVEDLWEINGTTFEVTHEEFRSLNHSIYHHEGEEPGAERAVA